MQVSWCCKSRAAPMLPLQESNGNYRGRLLQRRRAAPAPVATCGRVALPKNETSILRVLVTTEGVFGPCPRKTSRRKLKVRDLKKNCVCARTLAAKRCKSARKKQCRIGPRAAQVCNTCDGWPADACDAPRARTGSRDGRRSACCKTDNEHSLPPKKLTINP